MYLPMIATCFEPLFGSTSLDEEVKLRAERMVDRLKCMVVS